MALYSVGFSNSVARVLERSRIYVAWLPVGISMGALEHAVKYVQSRVAFNAPLASNQLIQGVTSFFASFLACF